MTEGAKTILYPAKAVFSAVLGPPTMDEPYYVGWTVAGQSIGLDPNGHANGLTGATPYWHVTDLPNTLQALVDAGAEPIQHAKDVGGGKLVASVRDPEGNVIGLIQEA